MCLPQAVYRLKERIDYVWTSMEVAYAEEKRRDPSLPPLWKGWKACDGTCPHTTQGAHARTLRSRTLGLWLLAAMQPPRRRSLLQRRCACGWARHRAYQHA